MNFVTAVNLMLAFGPLADRAAKPPRPVVVTEQHYRVYDAKGNPATLEQVLQRMQAADVVFLGEHHDDPVAHHLQLQLFKAAQEQRVKQPATAPPRPLALALEMFERDVQHIVDEYLSGLINEQNFLSSARPWNNYKGDYRPLVEFARDNKLAVLAANAPRRYVNRVGRLGAASLKDVPDPLHRGLPPLPYGEASPAYAAKFNDLMKKMHRPEPSRTDDKKPKVEEKKPAGQEHDTGKGLEAQSLWDAAMAYTIAEHLLRSPKAQVIHLNGSFHSEKRMGIPDHLLRYRPGTSLLVVTMVSHKAFPKFDVGDMADLGDFVVVTDPSLPRSYTSRPPEKK